MVIHANTVLIIPALGLNGGCAVLIHVEDSDIVQEV